MSMNLHAFHRSERERRVARPMQRPLRATPWCASASGEAGRTKVDDMKAAVRHQLDPTIRSSDTRDFQGALRAKIVGQEEGVQALVDLYQVFCAGLNSPGRPVGNLLFLGPTGSGKTRIVEAAAEILFGDPRAIIKVDCAELHHSLEIANLLGSSPAIFWRGETRHVP